jgi:hypothetical protein
VCGLTGQVRMGCWVFVYGAGLAGMRGDGKLRRVRRGSGL